MIVFLFSGQRYDRYNDPKNTKPTTTSLRKQKQAGFPFACIYTCSSNTRLKFSRDMRGAEGTARYGMRTVWVFSRDGMGKRFSFEHHGMGMGREGRKPLG